MFKCGSNKNSYCACSNCCHPTNNLPSNTGCPVVESTSNFMVDITMLKSFIVISNTFRVYKIDGLCAVGMQGASTINGMFLGSFGVSATVSGLISPNIWRVDGYISNDGSPLTGILPNFQYNFTGGLTVNGSSNIRIMGNIFNQPPTVNPSFSLFSL